MILEMEEKTATDDRRYVERGCPHHLRREGVSPSFLHRTVGHRLGSCRGDTAAPIHLFISHMSL